MFSIIRFPLLLTCLVAVTLAGCNPEMNSSSSTSQSSPEDTVEALSPEKQEQVKGFIKKGNQKIANGEYQVAIEEFNQALAIEETNAKALGYRGVAHSQLENYEQALEDYNQSLNLNANNYQVYYNRGLLKTRLEDHDRAINDFTEAIQRQPKFAAAIGSRGFAYAELENYEAAIKDLEKASQLFEENGNKRTAYRLQRAARYIQP